MKRLLFFAISMLLLSGCAYKNENINLESYKAEYRGPLSKDKKSVTVRYVKDMRQNKGVIGYVDQKKDETIKFYSDVNFAEKYTEGLGYALNLAGFNTETPSASGLMVEIYIKDIKIIYNDKNFDANLKGEIEIEVVVRKGEDEITQSFRQKGSKWIAPSYNSKDLEPFLYTLFADSIDQIVTRLTKM